MQVAGKLVVINATQVVSDKFSKRIFVVETSDQYPQSIEFQLTQDKCDCLDAYKLGDEVNVSLNIRGREWTSPAGEVKYFNTLEAWKIERIGTQLPTPKQPLHEEADDLPF